MYYLCCIEKHLKIKDMKNKVTTVVETNMYDGVDLIHTWTTADEARDSGRFDFLIENGEITTKRFDGIKRISTLVNLAPGCFYIK
jgi:hypothetical protein